MQAAKDASASRSKAAAAGVGGDEDFGERMRQKVASKRKTPLDPTTQAAPVQDAQDGARDDEEEADSERDDEDGDGARTAKRSRMDGLSKAARTSAAVVAPSRQIKVQNRELLTDWERRRQEYKERKRLGGRREQDTMSKLKSFLGKMKSAGGKEGSSAETAHAGGEQGAVAPGSTALQAGEEVEAGYNGEIDKDLDHRKYMPAAWRLDDYLGGDDGDDDGGSLETLRGHRFEFGDGKKEGTRQPDSLDQYVVLDPLLEMGKAKFNRQQQQRKKRDNEWAGRSRD